MPIKYDRELMGATIKAMKRVAEIKAAREERFYKSRMKGVKAAEKAAAQLEIQESIDLVAPAAVRKGEEINVAEVAKIVAKAGKSIAKK